MTGTFWYYKVLRSLGAGRKKTQKDKKSGLFLSYVYTVYKYQNTGKPWKLDTLFIP